MAPFGSSLAPSWGSTRILQCYRTGAEECRKRPCTQTQAALEYSVVTQQQGQHVVDIEPFSQAERLSVASESIFRLLGIRWSQNGITRTSWELFGCIRLLECSSTFAKRMEPLCQWKVEPDCNHFAERRETNIICALSPGHYCLVGKWHPKWPLSMEWAICVIDAKIMSCLVPATHDSLLDD